MRSEYHAALHRSQVVAFGTALRFCVRPVAFLGRMMFRPDMHLLALS